MITFSYRTEISIKLNQYHDIGSFNKVSLYAYLIVFERMFGSVLCVIVSVCLSVVVCVVDLF